MIRKVTPEIERILLAMPESGMGYQIVEFRDGIYGPLVKAVAYNARLVIDFDNAFSDSQRYVSRRGVMALFRDEGATRSMNTIKDLRVVGKGQSGRQSLVAEPFARRCGRRSGGISAEDSTGVTADGKEEFVRLSADPNDKRVDVERKRLVPGTYTTTLTDYRLCVECPDDPVDRYALPNPSSITTAFHVRPALGDGLQRGIVQPNFGHDGGGAEAFFKNGTSDGSLIGIKPYGQ